MIGIPVVYLWLASGAIFLAVEAFGIPGIGFFFAGMAALSVSSLLALGVVAIDNAQVQILWFLGFSAFWAAVLWKPFTKFRTGSKGHTYNNIIGHHAIVAEPGLRKGHEGKATWSGTIMMAELLATASTDSVPAGTKVLIVDVKGAKLIVDVQP